MRASQITVGGVYIAKVNNKLTSVRLDAIKSNFNGKDLYYVTNISTGRKTIFHSPSKFRAVSKIASKIASKVVDAETEVTNQKDKTTLQLYRYTKAKHPDTLLLFRTGDFYELFEQDAETAHRVLGLALTTLTSRDKEILMTGFPYHYLDNYLQKLLQQGYRVTVCDPVEASKVVDAKPVVLWGEIGNWN